MKAIEDYPEFNEAHCAFCEVILRPSVVLNDLVEYQKSFITRTVNCTVPAYIL